MKLVYASVVSGASLEGSMSENVHHDSNAESSIKILGDHACVATKMGVWLWNGGIRSHGGR